MALIRFLATVRKLRARQVAAQIKRRLLPVRPSEIGKPPEFPGIRLESDRPFIPPAQDPLNLEAPQTGRLSFLNREEELGWPPAWIRPGRPKLWDYNLHYHDFLWSLPLTDALEAVMDWIRSHPNERGRTGWEPYPISMRVQTWCMLFFGVHRDKLEHHADAARALWASLFHQVSWLEKHLEWHLLGNHILENGAALAFAGATFEGAAARRWLTRGVEILKEQLDEIVLRDGGHVERSPMYQARLYQMLANLVATGNPLIATAVGTRDQHVRTALTLLCHPDRNIALFNDSAFGIYPGPPQEDFQQVPSGPFVLPDTGYYGAISPSGHYVLCDAGPIGPDYQPGHAHGDTLSFELSIEGVRFVVDSGVYNYERDEWRAYARSTRAHNTIELNRLDQSEFWAAFRVGRRAYPQNVEHRVDGAGFFLGAEHTGYQRLAGRPVHRRRFRWYNEGVLMVGDRVSSSKPVWMRSHIHLHPDVKIEMRSERTVLLTRDRRHCTVTFARAGRLHVESSWYFPEFGSRMANRTLVLTERAASLESGFCLAAGKAPMTFDLETGAVIDGVTFRW